MKNVIKNWTHTAEASMENASESQPQNTNMILKYYPSKDSVTCFTDDRFCLKENKVKAKAVPIHAMEALGGRGV
jgi:hypothetical protein